MVQIAPQPHGHVDDAGRLVRGRWLGSLSADPAHSGPRRGRLRRWCYVGAGDEHAAVGAAIVDLGAVVVAFAWGCLDGHTVTWQTRRPRPRRGVLAPVPHGESGLDARGARVALGGAGSMDLDVPVRDGRLRARIEAAGDSRPVVLSTPTSAGGWNVTQKTAGHAVRGQVGIGSVEHDLGTDAGGWRDWTTGRQDRRTVWRWAAGAGVDGTGRRVGLNVSTGMNELGPGEDLVWWDGRPMGLDLERLAPTGARPEGPWTVSGPGWGLRFEPWGLRAADENLVLIRSRYVQPVGRFAGTLPGPDGEAVEVALTGVTEDHLAVW